MALRQLTGIVTNQVLPTSLRTLLGVPLPHSSKMLRTAASSVPSGSSRRMIVVRWALTLGRSDWRSLESDTLLDSAMASVTTDTSRVSLLICALDADSGG